MANARAHMNNQAGMRLRRVMTSAGRASSSGRVSIHRRFFAVAFGGVEIEPNGYSL
jgi:hypothetical protein